MRARGATRGIPSGNRGVCSTTPSTMSATRVGWHPGRPSRCIGTVLPQQNSRACSRGYARRLVVGVLVFAAASRFGCLVALASLLQALACAGGIRGWHTVGTLSASRAISVHLGIRRREQRYLRHWATHLGLFGSSMGWRWPACGSLGTAP